MKLQKSKTIISLTCLTLFFCTEMKAQQLNDYLQKHHFSFSIKEGFDKSATDILEEKLRNYRIFLQAEGGSHYLKFYAELEFMWLSFLNTTFGATHFFGESGHSSDVLLNKYLRTGDTSYLLARNRTFWELIYSRNQMLSDSGKFEYFGIDFESPRHYTKALKLLLPKAKPSGVVVPYIELIKKADGDIIDCDYILDINKKLKKILQSNRNEIVDYFGVNFQDFERIILNGRTCKDSQRDRNQNMVSNLLLFDKVFNKQMYYGELGMAHTLLNNPVFASIINTSQGFQNKVCVVNLYCYKCKTPEEQVSNWPLSKIENDILTLFLPFCKSDFTLFDLSENAELIKKYSDYGQFLIVAKNQN